MEIKVDRHHQQDHFEPKEVEDLNDITLIDVRKYMTISGHHKPIGKITTIETQAEKIVENKLSEASESINQDETETNNKIQQELEKFEALLNTEEPNFNLIFEQACLILALLGHRIAQLEKKYAMNKDDEIKKNVQELQNTFNTWKTLTTSIICGVLGIAGGAMGCIGAFPGASWADKLVKFGQGVSSASTATQAFGNITGNSEQAERALAQHHLEKGKDRRGHALEGDRQQRELREKIINQARQALQAAHQAMQSVLQNR